MDFGFVGNFTEFFDSQKAFFQLRELSKFVNVSNSLFFFIFSGTFRAFSFKLDFNSNLSFL